MKNVDVNREYKSSCLGEVALPICISGYEDNKLVDIEGNSYIDFTSGYGVANTGWGRKELIEIASNQLQKLNYSPPWFPTNEAVELAALFKKKPAIILQNVQGQRVGRRQMKSYTGHLLLIMKNRRLCLCTIHIMEDPNLLSI